MISTISLVSLTAAAQEKSTPPALVLVPVAGPPSATTGLTEALHKTLTSLGRPAQRSALSMDELMLAVGCTGQTIACLQQIGESIQSKGLITGTARRTKKGVVLSLRWFDVKSGGDSGRARATLDDDPEARTKQLRDAVKDLFGLRSVRPKKNRGGLEISTTVDNVEIFINGQSRGVTPLLLRDLEPGVYHLEAKSAGHAAWQGETEVRPDQTTRLEIELEPAPAVPPSPGFFDSIKTRTWVAAGTGAALMAVAIAFGAHMNAVQDDLDHLQGHTFAEIRQMEQLKETGERDALVANIFFGVGGAVLAASVALAILDYNRGRPHRPPADQPEGPARLTIGPSSVGFSLSF
jgi:hypothetical protein